MWHVELENDVGDVIASADIYVSELKLEDVANLNWSLSSGDKITIEEVED